VGDPDVPWNPFTSIDGDVAAYGNPGVGVWAITPEVQLSAPNQTAFSVRIAQPKQKVVAEIQSVEWVRHGNPDGSPSDEAGELVDDALLGKRFFPDAEAPGESARRKVDLLVQVAPSMAGIPVFARWHDVDDWTDDDGPIDQDPDPRHRNNGDNFVTGTGPEASLPPSAVTDVEGRVRFTFTIGWIQPGNNFRIAVGGHSEEVWRTKPLAANWVAALFFDADEDDYWDDSEELMDGSSLVHGIGTSEVLTVWRKLHVEVDSMGAVSGNTVHNVAAAVSDNGDGTYDVQLATPLSSDDANNRFENGMLTDSQGYVYDIVSNDANVVRVRLSGNPMPPMANADVWLQDDDYLKDGWDVPMPDLGLMDDAYAAAFIEPVVDGGGDPGNNKDNLQFVLNLPDGDELARVEAQGGLESHANRSPAFWIAYIQAAFQPAEDKDNDPDSELSRSGFYPGKGALVYLETARDVALEHGFSEPDLFVQRVVVHEIAHEFSVADGQGPRPSIMHYPDLHNPNQVDGSRFNESQLETLRSRVQSPGA